MTEAASAAETTAFAGMKVINVLIAAISDRTST
jgi:hypothetical protein